MIVYHIAVSFATKLEYSIVYTICQSLLGLYLSETFEVKCNLRLASRSLATTLRLGIVPRVSCLCVKLTFYFTFHVCFNNSNVFVHLLIFFIDTIFRFVFVRTVAWLFIVWYQIQVYTIHVSGIKLFSVSVTKWLLDTEHKQCMTHDC